MRLKKYYKWVSVSAKQLTALLFFLALGTQLPLNAQFNFQKEIRERGMIVVLVDKKEDTESLSKKISLEDYNKGVEAYNLILESSLNKYWKHSEMKFYTTKEFLELPGELAYENVICYSSKVLVKGREFLKFSMNFIYNKGGKNVNKSKDFYLDIERGKVPDDAAFFYFTRKMEVFFEYEYQFSRRGLDDFLSKYTLLVDPEMTKPGEDVIPEHYPHPFKMSSKEEIEKIANEKQKGFIYVRYGRYSYDRVSFMFVNCETGEIVARSVFQEKLKLTFNSQSNRNRTKESKQDAIRNKEPFYFDYGNESIGRELKTLYISPVKFQKINFEHMSSMRKQYSVYPDLIDF